MRKPGTDRTRENGTRAYRIRADKKKVYRVRAYRTAAHRNTDVGEDCSGRSSASRIESL